MENKKTTELLDLLNKVSTADKFDNDKYKEIVSELKLREPFFSIYHEDSDEGLPQLLKRVEELEDTVKKLRRHKHDPKNDDVLIRI